MLNTGAVCNTIGCKVDRIVGGDRLFCLIDSVQIAWSTGRTVADTGAKTGAVSAGSAAGRSRGTGAWEDWQSGWAVAAWQAAAGPSARPGPWTATRIAAGSSWNRIEIAGDLVIACQRAARIIIQCTICTDKGWGR